MKAHAWKVCIRQKRIEGSNPSPSAMFIKAVTVGHRFNKTEEELDKNPAKEGSTLSHSI